MRIKTLLIGKTLLRFLLSALRRRVALHRRFELRKVRGQPVRVLREVPQDIFFYYHYIVGGIQRELEKTKSRKQVFIGLSKDVWMMPKNSVKVVIQHEQMVRCDGTIQLHGIEAGYLAADFILDYSSVNVRQVACSDMSFLYEGRAFYIAPMYKGWIRSRPDVPLPKLATIFGRTGGGRRGDLLKVLSDSGLTPSNIQNYSDLSSLHKDVSILLTTRQFEELCVPEELRILPALLSGVLIVSEESKWSQSLPYSQFIIWSNHEGFSDKLRFAIREYASLWNTIFLGGELTKVLDELETHNRSIFNRIASTASFSANFPIACRNTMG